MPWKSKTRQYACPRCNFVIGGLSVPIKRAIPSGCCPKCGAALKLATCDHPTVKQLSRWAMCMKCQAIVEWSD